MIIDSNLVSIDGQALSGTITPTAIPLNLLKKPGKVFPIPVCVRCSTDTAGGTSITIGFSQSDTQAGIYTDVSETTTVALADLQKGYPVGPRFLPTSIVKPWVKITVTKTGNFTAGTVFAAVTREEEQPYEEGYYINKGVVVG